MLIEHTLNSCFVLRFPQLFYVMNEKLEPLYHGCESNRNNWQLLARQETPDGSPTDTGAIEVLTIVFVTILVHHLGFFSNLLT